MLRPNWSEKETKEKWLQEEGLEMWTFEELWEEGPVSTFPCDSNSVTSGH